MMASEVHVYEFSEDTEDKTKKSVVEREHYVGSMRTTISQTETGEIHF